MKKYYAHTNPNVVVSIESGARYCTYHEVIDGVIKYDDVLSDVAYHLIDEWVEVSPSDAELILQDAINRQIGKVPLKECFTTIDVHMFSSGEANEL